MSNLNKDQKDTLNSIVAVNRVNPVRPDYALIKPNKNISTFTNPLTNRTINNNTRSRYIVNRNIKKANEVLNTQRTTQERNNNLTEAKVIGGLSTFLKVRLDTKNIHNTRELYNFLLKNFNTGKGGYALNNVFISFVNDSNQVIWRSIPQDYLGANDFELFNAYINNLYNGEAIGSDSINADEFKIDLSHIDLLYLQTALAQGDSDNIIFEIEDVNNIEGNKPNECIHNSLAFVGYDSLFSHNHQINNITTLIKFIVDNKLPIDIISNSVQDIRLIGNNEKFFINNKLNLGRKLNACEYRLKLLHYSKKCGCEETCDCVRDYRPFLFVYDSQKKHIDVVKYKSNNIYDNSILIKDNVYIKDNSQIFTINNDIPKNIIKPRELYDLTDKGKNQNEVHYIFFDYETVIDWTKNNCMREYSLSWFYISHNDVEEITKKKLMDEKTFKLKNYNCFNEIGFDCSLKFIEWFNEFQINKICKFVSYNGANFDNYFLLNAMLEYKKNNENKINISDLLYSGNQLLNFKINGCHNMYDLHKHLMGSLKSNCESFKIPKKYSKLDCDHNEIQILYNNDKDNFINIMKQKEALIEYNNNDVYSLCCLFIKYYQSMSNIEGFEFLVGEKFCEVGTIGSMIMKRAKNLWAENKIELPKLNFQQYNDVLKYKIAGRVEIFSDKEIKVNEEIVSLDVCSLYPYIMAIHQCYMPSGEIIEVDSYQGDDVLGFYYCDIDQRALKKHNLPNIYAEKTETENKWSSNKILKDYLITNVTIKLLNKYKNIGVKCEVKKGFVFTKKIKNIELFKFLMPLMNIKNQQDELKRNKDATYNPALRECVKLLMNSVSGKVIEGLHSENIKMISDIDDLLKLQSKQAKNKIRDINIINNVGDNLFVSYKIDEESIINKQKPVYLGAFIYEYARTYMYENLLSVVGLDKCLYMDTDALKFRKSDLAEWQLKKGNNIVNHWAEVEQIDTRYKSHILFNENSKVFGSLENELKTNNIFYAVQKKFWLTANINKDNEITYIKTRYKGINPSSLLLNENSLIIETKKDKLNLNIHKEELFNWINNNKHLTIGSDYDKYAKSDDERGFIGKQLELFENLYNNKKVIVLVSNMRRIVKNGLRNVEVEEKERYNLYNNKVQINYMLKAVRLTDKIENEEDTD